MIETGPSVFWVDADWASGLHRKGSFAEGAIRDNRSFSYGKLTQIRLGRFHTNIRTKTPSVAGSRTIDLSNNATEIM
ncbi:MAG: hypothetical protein JWM11_1242 [Planctomycetaceae bacterium]|nr:hypothetical protein [Planctomycetaceae bacterium]